MECFRNNLSSLLFEISYLHPFCTGMSMLKTIKWILMLVPLLFFMSYCSWSLVWNSYFETKVFECCASINASIELVRVTFTNWVGGIETVCQLSWEGGCSCERKPRSGKVCKGEHTCLNFNWYYSLVQYSYCSVANLHHVQEIMLIKVLQIPWAKGLLTICSGLNQETAIPRLLGFKGF